MKVIVFSILLLAVCSSASMQPLDLTWISSDRVEVGWNAPRKLTSEFLVLWYCATKSRVMGSTFVPRRATTYVAQVKFACPLITFNLYRFDWYYNQELYAAGSIRSYSISEKAGLELTDEP
ncbi:hypothetical protein D915_009488 [Fasciola hepatica]|uniref:Fibronectin type III domain protein n=1 Tax=Fasciola hepatica TaxID=6192 RepID=A0A4E0RDD4_FASHE|nr:hypothetical protein D915_009488 [Fasciola hepatica]